VEALQKKAMRVKFQVEGQKTGLKPKTVGLTAWTDDATLSRARNISTKYHARRQTHQERLVEPPSIAGHSVL
jgi:hypothetical protein